MTKAQFEFFAVCVPGLEPQLRDELIELGYKDARAIAGGVVLNAPLGAASDLNMRSRGATRFLVRVAQFPAVHLSQLDKKARKLDWDTWIKPGTSVGVEASCKRSKIYHSGAAKQRVAQAIMASIDAKTPEGESDPDLSVMVRIDRDLCTISLDTSGTALHKRGFKQAVGKAPLRESMAALFLRALGYDGSQAVADPLCGSGSFLLEAAQWHLGLAPGRMRSFAYQHIVGLEAQDLAPATPSVTAKLTPRFFGFDRDAGAVRSATENAERGGVASLCQFSNQSISALSAPDGVEPGLVIANPPYGERIGEIKKLAPLYASMGKVLAGGFTGWRVGIVTTSQHLIDATGLPFAKPGPVVHHGGIKVRLWPCQL